MSDSMRSVFYGNSGAPELSSIFARKVARQEGISESEAMKGIKEIDYSGPSDAYGLGQEIARSCTGNGKPSPGTESATEQMEKVVEDNLKMDSYSAESTNWRIRKADVQGDMVALGLNKVDFLTHAERKGVAVYIYPSDNKALVWAPDTLGTPFKENFNLAPSGIRYGFFIIDCCTSDNHLPYFD